MWMVASIQHHPRTHAVGWVHLSRLMGASFPWDGRISPVGSMHAPAGWVHPCMGMGASLSWDRCIDVVGARADVVGGCAHPAWSMHPCRMIDKQAPQRRRCTYPMTSTRPPCDVDAPIPLGRAPIPWEGRTHTTGRMHPIPLGHASAPPTRRVAPRRTNRAPRCRSSRRSPKPIEPGRERRHLETAQTSREPNAPSGVVTSGQR